MSEIHSIKKVFQEIGWKFGVVFVVSVYVLGGIFKLNKLNNNNKKRLCFFSATI